jgi:hypothetical protein
MVNAEDVRKELELHDRLDLVLILAIGPKPASHLEIQKRAILISSILHIDPEAEPYDYGLYSETITEKLQDAKNVVFFRRRKDNLYELTPLGRQAYEFLLDKLKVKEKDLPLFIETIRKMDEKELLVLTYHLFPSSLEESKIKNEVLALIKQYTGKGFIKAKKEGGKLVMEVDA